MSEPVVVKALFERPHFDREVVMLCVRWYLHSRLSLRDLVEMTAERGLWVAHTTIMRWVQRCAAASGWIESPLGGAMDQPWRAEETCIKVRGKWRYLYRAVDSSGQTVDFWLSDRCDMAAAILFFDKTVGVNFPAGQAEDSRPGGSLQPSNQSTPPCQ